MKNKILAILCVALIAMLGFASCEEEVACEHTFSSKWSTNETNHWHAATCEHGEMKSQNAAHVDVDENGICDTCEYEVGHDHTYAEAWSFDEEKHWKAASCTHTDEKGEEGLHADDDVNGKCDVCENHVHILDGAGFCHGCDKEIKPVDEFDIASVVSATTARWDRVVSGKVEYKNDITSSVSGTVIDSRWHNVEYLFGTNGTYSKRTEDEIKVSDNTAEKTGDMLVTEKWIALLANDEVEGAVATSVNGKYLYAEPSAFGLDDLRGYYFAASTLADGHGPEALLLALYEASIDGEFNKVSNLSIDHDAENNTYTLIYDVLTINTDVAAGEDHNVNFYNVDVKFTYADDYTLTSLDVKLDCYTNSLEDSREHDFTYDQETQTITMKDNASADTYTFKVTQTVGVREEIALEDGSAFSPTDFELFTNEDLTDKAENISSTVGDVDDLLYIGCTPAGSYSSFITNDIEIIVKDSEGNESIGLMLTVTGDVIYVLPMQPGEYVVTVSALGKTKTLNVTVDGEALPGANKFQVVGTTTYEWVDSYTFTADKSGTYTFYAPYGLGIWLDSELTNGQPRIDPVDPYNNETSFTVTLRKGATLTFYYLVYVKDVPYFIGYDYTAPQS